MPRRRRSEDEYIPIKIEGWNGKFVYNHGNNKGTSVNRNQQHSNISNFYGQYLEPEILPPTWDGTFVTHGNGMPIHRAAAQQRNQSTDNQYFGINTEPEILPTQWSGKFEKSSEVRIKPERNFSDATELHGYSNEPEILPTQWSGKFELDPNDVRIRPERNCSDVRNYAEAHRFKRQS